MRRNTWWLALMVGVLSLGQPAACLADDARLLRAAQTVLQEYRIYATCTSLFPGSLELVQEAWNREVRSGADYLKDSDRNTLLLIRYQALVVGGKLYDPQMPLGEAVSLCERNKEALHRYHTFDFLHMATELEKVAGGRADSQGGEAGQ